MNNTFNIKRFGNYFLYDLNRARANYMWSAIVMALLPVVFFAIAQLYSFLFANEFSESVGIGTAPVAASALMIASMLTFPVKMYGSITDKRAGSNYLMIPASTFEKWFTMILMTCVVMPLALILSFLAVDSVMALCLGEYYGHGIIYGIANLGEFAFEGTPMVSHFSGLGYLEWICSVLIFTLGAICFKTGKVGKTILTLILVGVVIITIFFAVVMLNIEGLTDYFGNMEEEQVKNVASLLENVVWLGWAWYALEFSALAGAIYYRLKTITH